jgi:S1-C subfamily serine protease
MIKPGGSSRERGVEEYLMKPCRILAALLLTVALCQARGRPPVPDLTKGGARDDKHDWTLGPTGARGWIWAWDLETTPSRQVLVTQVDKGSPADGVLEVGDVILGIDGTPFDADARKSPVLRSLDLTKGKR